MGQAPLRHEAGQPGQQEKVRRDRRGQRAGRRRRSGIHGGARLQRQGLLLSGQSPPGPLHRRPGWHQRGKELPERRRQRLPPLLRHGQGRRLPGSGGQRSPPRRGLVQHHRPMRGPGRALRQGVRRHPGQPLVRRSPRLPDLLRSGPDRAAAAPRCVPGLDATGRAGQGGDVQPPRDAGHRPDRRPRPGHRGPRHGHGGVPDTPRRRGGSGHRRLRQRPSISPHTPRGATPPRRGGPTRRAPHSPTPATRRSTPRASRSTASTRASSHS